MNTSTITYTSATGVVNDDEPVVIEQVVSKKVRINDPSYGLKTAAKKTHDAARKERWKRERDEAIARQRANEQSKRDARVADLDTEIQRLNVAIMSGQSSDPVKAKAFVVVLTEKRKKMVG